MVDGFENLNNPVKDANDLVKVLTSIYDFELPDVAKSILLEGIYDGKEIYEYRGDKLKCFYNKNATRKNIMKCLANWSKEIGEDDNLLIFFSGHGHVVDGQLNLVNQEFDEEDDPITYWDLVNKHFSKYENIVGGKRIKKCKHFLLILDCCNAGNPSFGVVNNPLTDAEFSRQILAATQPTESAVDGPSGINSPFMANLLTILINEYELNHENYGIDAEQLAKKLKKMLFKENQTPPYGTLPGADLGKGHFTFHARYNFPSPKNLNDSLYLLNFYNLKNTIYKDFEPKKNRFNVITLQNGKVETHRFLRKRIFKAMKGLSNSDDCEDPNYISDDFCAWAPINLNKANYNNAADFWQILKQIKELEINDHHLNEKDKKELIKNKVLEQIALELKEKNLVILFYFEIGSKDKVEKFVKEICDLVQSLYDNYKQSNSKLFLIFSDLRGDTPILKDKWFGNLDKNIINIIYSDSATETIKQKDINAWVNEHKEVEELFIDRFSKLSLGSRELDFIDYLHEKLPEIGFTEGLKAEFIAQVISDNLTFNSIKIYGQ
jgi:hypothetical protein